MLLNRLFCCKFFVADVTLPLFLPFWFLHGKIFIRIKKLMKCLLVLDQVAHRAKRLITDLTLKHLLGFSLRFKVCSDDIISDCKILNKALKLSLDYPIHCFFSVRKI